MDNNIKTLVETYYTNTEQLNNVMKNMSSAEKKYQKDNDSRHLFLMKALGKPLYNKFVKLGSTGTFAPIDLSGVRLTLKDFEDFRVMNGYDTKDDKLMDVMILLKDLYKTHDFKIINDAVVTDISLLTMDDVIDFYMNIFKAFSKVYRVKYNTDDLTWTPINKKFKKYLG